jgi:hypothetical protein
MKQQQKNNPMKILFYLSSVMIATTLIPVMLNVITDFNEKIFLLVNIISWGLVNLYTSKKLNNK